MVQTCSLKPKLLVIAGPTGVGKTKLAIECYKTFNCQLISTDSMQIYKNCDIGTAKISKELQELYPHRNIDIVDYYEEFNVANFKDLTQKQIAEIVSVGQLPILVGGTGLYIESILFPYDFSNCSKNLVLRENLEKEYDEFGGQFLIDKISLMNPDLTKGLYPNNKKRIIRFYEIAISNSKANNIKAKLNNLDSQYDYEIIFLFKDREQLYKDINNRVDTMIAQGLVNEARTLYEYEKTHNVKLQASYGIGYKELFPYFDGSESLTYCVEKIKQHSRNYAKRQITWYNRYTNNILKIDISNNDEYSKLLAKLKEIYKSFLK